MMRCIPRITISALLLGIVSPAMAGHGGDVGSPECRAAQLDVYDLLAEEGLYENHGRLMQAVNRLLNEQKNRRIITGRCAACIRSQYARRIPPRQQQPCGIDEDSRAILDFATSAFERIRAVVDPADETPLRAEFVGTHVEVASGSWVYVLDSIGSQVFRPIAAYPHIESAFFDDISPFLDDWLQQPVPQSTVEAARAVVLSTVGAEYVSDPATEVTPVRELITSKSLDSEVVRSYEGRTMVLFRPFRPDEARAVSYHSSLSSAPDGSPVVRTEPLVLPLRSYETAVTFAPGGDVMRVESASPAPEAEEIVGLLRAALMRGTIPARPYPSEINLRFGGFFSPEEPRFELTAYSYEGEKFLDPADPCWQTPTDILGCNPFWPFTYYSYCYNSVYATDVNSFIRPSRLYRADTFEIWNEYGRKNGIRGNWDESSQTWEIPDVDVAVHANLRDYQTVEPHVNVRTFATCDEDENGDPIEFTFWNSEGNKLQEPFYDDLESIHVAMINTHGGPIWSHRDWRFTFQFLRNYDEWVVLRDVADDGLGTGRLRHLFLESCSGINWLNNWRDHPKNLVSDWMNPHAPAGIRTIGGYDGGRIGGQTTGWRFFGHYQRGESISQSWINMALEEYECNAPVMLAYGTSESDAAATLFDGRFTKSRTDANWAIAVEPLTEELLAPRGCCNPFAGVACSDLTHAECEAVGGEPLDCGTTCAEDYQCGCLGICD